MPLPDISSLDAYGGPIADYSPVTDPTTDEAAKFRNQYVCDVAALGHTGARALVRFLALDNANPTDPTGFVHDAMWGNASGVKPVIARTGEGVWTVTFPSTVQSELTPESEALGGGVSHTVNIRDAWAKATPVSGVLKHASAVVTSANVVTVYGYLANGTADDLLGSIISVIIW